MAVDCVLYVLSEVGIGYWRITERLFVFLREKDTLASLPAWSSRGFDEGDRTMILFHDYFNALLDLRNHCVNVAGKFGLGDA